MTTITLTKKHARDAVELLRWAKDEVKRTRDFDVEANWFSTTKRGIKFEKGSYWYEHSLRGDKYEFAINSKNKTVDEDYVLINSEMVLFTKLKNMLKDDIINEIPYLLSIDLKPLKDYLSTICDTKVKLNVTVDNNKLRIYTDNLIEYTGICKTMFKEIHIITTMELIINQYNGEQEVYISPINYDYEHSHGGHNGYEIAKVRYDKLTHLWYFYNYEKAEYVVM